MKEEKNSRSLSIDRDFQDIEIEQVMDEGIKYFQKDRVLAAAYE